MKGLITAILILFVVLIGGYYLLHRPYGYQSITFGNNIPAYTYSGTTSGTGTVTNNPSSSYFYRSDTTTVNNGGVMCAQDAMLCPNGSYVGRTGPNCSFVCPGSSTTTTSRGTVSGRVTLSPTCPVEQIPPDPNCAPRGYSTTIVVRRNGQAITTTSSDSNGEFSLTLSPGTYTIEPRGGQTYPTCSSTTVRVVSNSVTNIDFSCDSGIR
jgi:hypothetical protein